MKNIVLIISFLLLISCNNFKSKTKITDTVNNFIGNNIIIPDSTIFLFHDSLNNIKTDILNYKSKKIITIINGSCAKCINSINNWEEFFVKMKIKKESTYFIIENITAEKFKKFFYPQINHDLYLVIDEKHRFNNINKIPKGEIFKSFIIDENNKVYFIGSPLLNNDFANQYKILLK